MKATDNPYAAPDTLETTDPGQSWLQTSSVGLSRTLTGLNLVYYGIVIAFLSLISFVTMVIFPPLVFVSIIGVLFGYLTFLIGPLFCLAVPSETGAKSWIVGAVCFQLLGLGLTLVNGVMPGALPPIFRSAGSLAALISSILFMMFMRRLATYIGRGDLSAKAVNILVLGAAILLTSLVAPLARPQLDRVAWVLMIPSILFLVFFVMYANMINSLRLALKSGRRVDADGNATP